MNDFITCVIALRWILVLAGFAVAGAVIADLRIRLSASEKLVDHLLNKAATRPRIVALPPRREVRRG